VAGDQITFEADVENVRRARRLIHDVVSSAGGDADAAELLTAELATNAVIHAETRFTIRWEQQTSSIRIEVVNDSPEMIVKLVAASDEHGRGLSIVDQLACAWGVEMLPESKIVWFELPIAAAS
jgi:anti-sigma regulatory factor (Ser/Thr protein kinase)